MKNQILAKLTMPINVFLVGETTVFDLSLINNKIERVD